MNITIVGAGNIGTQLAVHCANTGNDVIIFSENYDKIKNEIKIVNDNNETILVGKIKLATNDLNIALSNCELLLITYPAFMIKDFAMQILPYASNDLKICIVPGTGGGECAFKEHIKKGAQVFGIQRVPSVARLQQYGECVKAVGYRKILYVSSIPYKFSNDCKNIVESILGINCEILPNYLNLTLTPSNPILHTTRLYNIFSNYEDKTNVGYDFLPLFYEDWNDDTTRILFDCDKEVQTLRDSIKDFNLNSVISLKKHYENDTIQGFTEKIKSIKGFKGIQTPSIHKNNKFYPDLNSRYFTADFNFGLKIILDIANLFNVRMFDCNRIYTWYDKIKTYNYEFSFKDYNINNKEELVKFYSL